MTFSLKKMIGISSASAEVSDNHLILSLPDALEPTVWRMSLDQIGSAAFEVKQDKGSDQTKLIMKPKKGTTEIIAPFANKKDAVDALMIASKALQNSGNNIKAPQKKIIVKNSEQPNDSHETVIINSSPSKEKQKWAIALLGALIVIGLYYYLMTIMPESIQEINVATPTASTAAAPTETVGVPVSADDFLGGL